MLLLLFAKGKIAMSFYRYMYKYLSHSIYYNNNNVKLIIYNLNRFISLCYIKKKKKKNLQFFGLNNKLHTYSFAK